MKVLSVVPFPTRVADRFRSHFEFVEGTLADADAVQPDVIACTIRPYKFDRACIQALPASVRAIATYSVGFDLTAAADRGIAVFNTPGVLADAVADAAMFLLLGAARRATESIALVRGGTWQGWAPDQLIGFELGGRRLGIFGMGAIGQRIAHRAIAFGMEVSYQNLVPVPSETMHYEPDPRVLIAQSDVIVLAWPSTPETRRFINAETLALAKPELILVNIGRGDLVDDAALIEALRHGRIFAAGLDVFDNEPDLNPGYLDLPNAFLLPHIGSSTWQARIAMADILVSAVQDHEAGKRPANRIA